jgi:hypothetical protein
MESAAFHCHFWIRDPSRHSNAPALTSVKSLAAAPLANEGCSPIGAPAVVIMVLGRKAPTTQHDARHSLAFSCQTFHMALAHWTEASPLNRHRPTTQAMCNPSSSIALGTSPSPPPTQGPPGSRCFIDTRAIQTPWPSPYCLRLLRWGSDRMTLPPPPTAVEIASFVPAVADACHQGVPAD